MRRPLIAILRGLEPDDAVPVTEVLIEVGITSIEVTLNSVEPLTCLKRMVAIAGARAEIGAGTVISVEQVAAIKECGARFVVSPNMNAEVIRATKEACMRSCPGVFTPSECFDALAAGADVLKLYPSFLLQPKGFRALRDVLPSRTRCYAVGGISPADFRAWLEAGISGFGIGSFLYSKRRPLDELRTRAQAVVAAYDRSAGAPSHS